MSTGMGRQTVGTAGKVPTRQVPNLDCLRAIAVLLVLGEHLIETYGQAHGRVYHPYDWYLGRLGVLLFFVHTSLVLMFSMDRSHLADGRLCAVFFIRRLFRIYPLAIVLIICVLLLRVPSLPWEVFSFPDAFRLASNFALTMNLTRSEPVLAPLWSLPVEIQMYCVLPLVYLWTKHRRTPGRVAIIWSVSIALALVHLYVLNSDRLNVLSFGPCFIAGFVAFAFAGKHDGRIVAVFWIPFLVLLIAAYCFIQHQLSAPHSLPVEWAFCLIVGAAIPLFRQSENFLINRCSKVVAQYSYGIYVFHCVAIWVGFAACSESPLVLQLFITVITLAALSFTGYHVIEKPAIDFGVAVANRLAGRTRMADAEHEPAV